MKKQIITGLAIILVVAFLLSLCGCGDTGKAKTYIDNGNDILTNLGIKTDILDGGLVAVLGGIKDGVITNGKEFEANAEIIQINIEEHYRDLKEAKAQFEKISELKGVEDYAKYAEMRIESIENAKKIPEAAEKILGDARKLVEDIEAGNIASDEEKARAADELIARWEKEDEELKEKAKKLLDEASKFKEEKKL